MLASWSFSNSVLKRTGSLVFRSVVAAVLVALVVSLVVSSVVVAVVVAVVVPVAPVVVPVVAPVVVPVVVLVVVAPSAPDTLGVVDESAGVDNAQFAAYEGGPAIHQPNRLASPV